jgi:predicted permease
MLEIQQDLRLAFRAWRRSWGIAVAAVLTLAFGIGAATALFSVVDAVLLRSFGYERSDRLVQIGGTNKQGQPTGVSAPDFLAIQQRAHLFERVGVSRVQAFTLSGPREPVNVYGHLVSQECFRILGARPLLGRTFTDADFRSDAPAVAVLAFKLWQREFAADPQIVGRRVLIDGAGYTVIGVMPREFQFPHPAFLIWAPWRLTASETANHRAHSYRLIARLKPSVSQEAAASELAALSTALERESPDTNNGWRTTVEPITEQLLGKLRPALFAMLGAVGFVLLIACLNVSNLLMVRGLARTREMAVRSALGASRARLALQLLTESLLLSGAAGACGLLLADFLLRLLLAMLPTGAMPLPRMDQAALDGRVLAAGILMTAVSGIVFGMLPALEFSRPDIEAALREGGRSNTGGVRRRRLLSGLILLESALSVVLLVGAGLMLRSFAQLMEVRPGFRADHVLVAEMPSPWRQDFINPQDRVEQKIRYFENVLDRLRMLPGVTSAALTTGLPMGTVATQTLIRLEGRDPGAGTDLRVGYSSVSPEFFQTIGITLERGRALAGTDTRNQPLVAMVNEAMARHLWPGEDAIGKRFTFNPSGQGPWVTVVGIAANVHSLGLNVDPDSHLYMSYRQSLLSPQTAAVAIRTQLDPASLAGAVRAAIHQVDPNQPVSGVRTMSESVANSVAQPRLYTVLLSIFGAFALALAAAGIFSVLSWTVNRKTHEIGIRMALGATSGDIVASVMGRVLLEVLLGAGAGLAGATALSGVLAGSLYHVTPKDPLALTAAPVVLLTAAALAAYIPARRSTRVDPAAALSAR